MGYTHGSATRQQQRQPTLATQIQLTERVPRSSNALESLLATNALQESLEPGSIEGPPHGSLGT